MCYKNAIRHRGSWGNAKDVLLPQKYTTWSDSDSERRTILLQTSNDVCNEHSTYAVEICSIAMSSTKEDHEVLPRRTCYFHHSTTEKTPLLIPVMRTTEIIVNGMISECAWIYNIQRKDSPQKALSTVETCAIAASPATEEHATRRIAGGRTTPSSNGDNELHSASNSSGVIMRNNSDDKIQKTQKPTCECVSNKEQWICRLSVNGRKLSKCLLWISSMKRED